MTSRGHSLRSLLRDDTGPFRPSVAPFRPPAAAARPSVLSEAALECTDKVCPFRTSNEAVDARAHCACLGAARGSALEALAARFTRQRPRHPKVDAGDPG